MVINGYYLYFGIKSDGARRKIDMQTRELSNFCRFSKIDFNKGIRSSALKKAIKCIPTARYHDKPDMSKVISPDFVYMRKVAVDKSFIEALRKVKEMNPDCKVVLEIPVWPYFKDNFCHDFKHFILSFPVMIKDMLYRGRLKKYVDYVSTFYEADELLGIPTLRIRNGLFVDDIKPITSDHFGNEDINILSVALMAPYHGYERVINGLAEYYANGGTRNIVFHMVGNGTEEAVYRELVKDTHMEDHVVFYGRKTGEELDAIYEKADLAVTSLGLYKIDIKIGSFIKTGEYLAKGIPMITGSEVDVLDHSDFDYFVEFPNNSSSIDMNKVVGFYDEKIRNKHRSDIVSVIREYAYKKVDMSVAMKSVTDIIKSIDK